MTSVARRNDITAVIISDLGEVIDCDAVAKGIENGTGSGAEKGMELMIARFLRNENYVSIVAKLL